MASLDIRNICPDGKRRAKASQVICGSSRINFFPRHNFPTFFDPFYFLASNYKINGIIQGSFILEYGCSFLWSICWISRKDWRRGNDKTLWTD